MNRQQLLDNLEQSRRIRAIRRIHLDGTVEMYRRTCRRIMDDALFNLSAYGKAFVKIDFKEKT